MVKSLLESQTKKLHLILSNNFEALTSSGMDEIHFVFWDEHGMFRHQGVERYNFKQLCLGVKLTRGGLVIRNLEFQFGRF